jgi:hypothetical protein
MAACNKDGYTKSRDLADAHVTSTAPQPVMGRCTTMAYFGTPESLEQQAATYAAEHKVSRMAFKV